jgi:protein-arginine kinase activator protein McsA
VPKTLQETRTLADRLDGLTKELEKAVAEENFEEAARVRDEIKLTRQKLESRSGA